MLSIRKKSPPSRVLRVYEVIGGKGLPAPPPEGLAGVWPQPPWYYFFYEKEAAGLVTAWLEQNPGWRLESSYSIPYEKWQDVSGEDLSIGRFVITTTEVEFEKHNRVDSLIPILIDPGIAFGSGLHPTTRGCLHSISELFTVCEGIDSVLDLGTGTGILAIASALLGAKRVWGIDCVPFTLDVARRNASTNQVMERIGFICSDSPEVVNRPCDLLLMNIEWPILKNILRGDFWRRFGRLVVSGFLEGTAAHVEEALKETHEIVRTITIEGWPTLTAERKSEVGSRKSEDGCRLTE